MLIDALRSELYSPHYSTSETGQGLLDFTSKDHAYVIQYSFKSNLTCEEIYEEIRNTYGLGEGEMDSNGVYKWTMDGGSTLELSQSRSWMVRSSSFELETWPGGQLVHKEGAPVLTLGVPG